MSSGVMRGRWATPDRSRWRAPRLCRQRIDPPGPGLDRGPDRVVAECGIGRPEREPSRPWPSSPSVSCCCGCVAGFALLAVWHLTATITGAARAGDRRPGQGGGQDDHVCRARWTAFTFASGGRTSSKEQTRTSRRPDVERRGPTARRRSRARHHRGRGITSTKAGAQVPRGPRPAPRHLGGPAGRVGYLAKGSRIGRDGTALRARGVRGSAAKTTGLDGALHSLREQPFGSILLTLVRAGIAACGVYSFARARYARVDVVPCGSRRTHNHPMTCEMTPLRSRPRHPRGGASRSRGATRREQDHHADQRDQSAQRPVLDPLAIIAKVQ